MFKKKNSLGFYELMIKHAQTVEDCVAALVEYCKDPTTEKGDCIKDLEKQADSVRKELVDDINHTFITPIDRDDLFRISTAVDDLADYAWNTIKELRIYEITPDKNLLVMSEQLKDAAHGITKCMENLEKNHEAVREEARKVKKMENTINMTFHESIAELFKDEDIRKILKYREIYNHMNHASDRADHCADLILDAVVKL